MIVDEKSIRITDKFLSDADASSIRWIKLKKSECNGCVEFWKVYLGFNKPSDHGLLRDGETQTRANHRISHDPKIYLALGVSICGVFTSFGVKNVNFQLAGRTSLAARRRCSSNSDQCRVGIWSNTWCATKTTRIFKRDFRLRFSTNFDVVSSYLLEIKSSTKTLRQFHEKRREKWWIAAVAVTASGPIPASSGLALGRGLVAGVRGVEWYVLIPRWWSNSPVFEEADGGRRFGVFSGHLNQCLRELI
ncbi:hypothetical protein LXL04_038819 [Taraxacum kok-saghyz]